MRPVYNNNELGAHTFTLPEVTDLDTGATTSTGRLETVATGTLGSHNFDVQYNVSNTKRTHDQHHAHGVNPRR